MRTLLVLLLVGLGACSVCDRLAAANAGYNDKKRGCPNQKQTEFNRAKCDTESKNCSENDVQKLNRFTACANKLPMCTKDPDTEVAFGTQSFACLGELVGVSLGCLGAVSLE